MQWITKALEPLRGQLPAPVMDQLTSALALVWGTEAMITLRDVTRLDVDDAKAVMLTAARWMLRGALLEQDDNPTPSRSTRQPRPRTRRRSQN
jgi:hypothetical protein